MKYYAIINDENICTGFASTPNDIVADNYIEITSLPAPIGDKYENGEWVEVPQEEPETPEEPTADELMDILLGVSEA